MYPQKRLLALIIVLTIFVKCPQLFGQYRFDSWTTDSGLPQNGLRAIAQTPDGYLWFTTFDGLVRFDGVKFTIFGKNNTKGIINNRFTGLYCDEQGTLYATTIEDGSLTIYRNGVFTSYNSEEVPGHYIESIKPHKGETGFLIVGGNDYSRSWYFLRDGKFVLDENIPKGYNRVDYTGNSGTQWTLLPDKVIETRDGATTVYNHRIERFDFTRDAFEDSRGGLWIGGFTLARLQNGKVESFGARNGFPPNADFHSFWEESDGSVWFANGGKSGKGLGLVRYQAGGFSSFGKESGLSDSSIFSVFRDREGTIWLATNKGLNRLRRNVIKTYSVSDGLNSPEVYPLYRDRHDNIWIGSTRGLTVYRDGKFEPVNLTDTDSTEPEFMKWKNDQIIVQALWEDRNGKIWIGMAGGIHLAENGKTRILRDSAPYSIFAIREDRAGNVWAATNKGLLLYRDYRLKAVYSETEGLPNRTVTTIFEDSRGRLWFGSFGGLSEFRDGQFINYSNKDGLTGNYVRSIYEDAEGTLWIGTYGEGLSRFKDGRFVNYNVENGLFNNDAFAIEEDRRGNFWISSNRGIYRVSRQQLNDFADGRIDKIHSIGYGKEDGMLNNECNGGRQPASVRDKNGNFWFPTQDGVVVISPENETTNPLAPPVVIESVRVDRGEIDFSRGLTIEPEQKNIEINFTALSLVKSEQVRFKYKLEGYDSDWTDAGTRRTAYYSSVPPGNYQFKVKAANSDGVWNEEGVVLNVELKSFFYQTRWFYFICLLGVCLIFLAIWKISLYQLQLRERTLARLVAEKTEELRKANEELQHLANSDSLTTVANRRYFEDFLANEWLRAIRSETEISLILIDIDHFKLFNDTHGHQAGDECLKRVALALRDAVHRPADLVARYGGEEFAIILGGTDREGALNIARQAMENVRNLQIPHVTSETSEYLSLSAGVATTFVAVGMSEAELIRAADKALYRAKEKGRNRIVCRDLTLEFENVTDLEQEASRRG